MGCSAGFASAPVSGKQLRAVAIQGSLSLALALGRAVQQAQHSKADPVAAAATAGNGNLIFKGLTLLFVTGLMFKNISGGGIAVDCPARQPCLCGQAWISACMCLMAAVCPC